MKQKGAERKSSASFEIGDENLFFYLLNHWIISDKIEV